MGQAPGSSTKPRTLTVLIHGLAETPMIMAPLDLALRVDGHEVENLSYPSTLEPPQALADRFIRPALEELSGFDRVNVVTHSLGGILLHYVLQTWRPENLGRVVMTAPGLFGSEALEVYRHNFLFRMIYGPSAYQSGTGADSFTRFLPKIADYELGVVAGCLSSDPIANLFIPWPHDGKISVPRTRVEGMADHIVLPVPHDLLSSHPLAVFQIRQFLQNGSFARGLSVPMVANAAVANRQLVEA